VSEAVLYKDSPAMFRNHPILFLICVALAPLGIGLLILIVWWPKCWQTSVVVTNDRVTLRKGILSKYTSDILISDIRNVQVAQNLVQRILGVGRVTVSTTGQADMEIDVNGLPHPERIQSIISKIRASSRKP
jgi:uncharacterized membrane protein YdbT with pleckstrin-like domain